MTESMVERVAKAIFEAAREGYHNEDWDAPSTHTMRDTYRKLARAAICAMREPTDAMVFECYGADHDPESIGETGRSYWQAMIDCALAEKPE